MAKKIENPRLSVCVKSTIKNAISIRGRIGETITIGKDRPTELSEILFAFTDSVCSLFGQFKDIDYVNGELERFKIEILSLLKYDRNGESDDALKAVMSKIDIHEGDTRYNVVF